MQIIVSALIELYDVGRNVVGASEVETENIAETPMQGEKTLVEHASRRLDRVAVESGSMRPRGSGAKALHRVDFASQRLDCSHVYNRFGVNLQKHLRFETESIGCNVCLFEHRTIASICDRF